MNDATRERLAACLLAAKGRFGATCWDDEFDEVIAFLRSEQCPRDGDVLLRHLPTCTPLSPDEEFLFYDDNGYLVLHATEGPCEVGEYDSIYRAIDIGATHD